MSKEKQEKRVSSNRDPRIKAAVDSAQRKPAPVNEAPKPTIDYIGQIMPDMIIPGQSSDTTDDEEETSPVTSLQSHKLMRQHGSNKTFATSTGEAKSSSKNQKSPQNGGEPLRSPGSNGASLKRRSPVQMTPIDVKRPKQRTQMTQTVKVGEAVVTTVEKSPQNVAEQQLQPAESRPNLVKPWPFPMFAQIQGLPKPMPFTRPPGPTNSLLHPILNVSAAEIVTSLVAHIGPVVMYEFCKHIRSVTTADYDRLLSFIDSYKDE